MSNGQKLRKTPLRIALECFVAVPILIAFAIVIPLTSVHCADSGYVPICVETTYFGLSAPGFAIVLVVSAVVCLIVGLVHLNRHKQTLSQHQ